MKEVVHVPTRELAEEVLRVAKENGYNTTPLDRDIKGSCYKENLCLELKPMSKISLYADIDYFESHEYSIMSAQKFLNRYKPKFRPIAMKCNQEQFDAVRSKLVGLKVRNLTTFNNCTYLVNNFRGDNLIISNLYEGGNIRHGRQVFKEWNEKTFLEYCGIDVKDDINELEQLRKENKELKQQLKELQDQPKVGDVCLFWDNGVNEYTLGLLREHSDDSYWSNNSYYHNCILYTDENLKKVIEQIKLNNK